MIDRRELIEYTIAGLIIGAAVVSVLHGVVQSIKTASVLPLLLWAVVPSAFVIAVRLSYRRQR